MSSNVQCDQNDKQSRISNNSTPKRGRSKSRHRKSTLNQPTQSPETQSSQRDKTANRHRSRSISHKRQDDIYNNENKPRTKSKRHKSKTRQLKSKDNERSTLAESNVKKESEIKDENLSVDGDIFDGKEDYIVEIFVERCERLELDAAVLHPVVKIHIFDIETGKYVKKSNEKRKAITQNENLDYILPIISKLRSLNFKNNEGWYKVAWGFLKPMGHICKPNLEKQVRLQLYRYSESFMSRIFKNTEKIFYKNTPGNQESKENLFELWKSGKWNKYPCTLFTTIRGRPPPAKRILMKRPQYPTDVERGKLTFDQHQWRRRMGQDCLLPNKIMSKIDAGENGSFCVSFSHNGCFLAVACVSTYSYPVKVFDVLSGERVAMLSGHQDLIYEVKWTVDDREIVTASSDGSVRIWGFNGDSMVAVVALFNHPSFVYSTAINSREEYPRIIATAGNDMSLRFWKYEPHTESSQIFSNLPYQISTEHKSAITSITFNKDGLKFYSADQNGILKVWNTVSNVFASQNDSLSNKLPQYQCIHTISILEGVPIHYICIHPSDRRLLVSTSNGDIHAIDLRIYRFITKYTTAMLAPKTNCDQTNLQSHVTEATRLRAKYSPCGNLVIVGTEEGVVMWKAESASLVMLAGSQISKFEKSVSVKSNGWSLDDLKNEVFQKDMNEIHTKSVFSKFSVPCPAVDVVYHPLDHIVAIAAFGAHLPVTLLILETK
ncbi:Jouberin [Nowakowskiella sp. JEL0078]|nr:Jouberin [Nowakowskiella sp. JEL0078]